MKIIVPLRPQSVQELTTLLEQITTQVDIVEIWLDGLVQELVMNPSRVAPLQQKLQTVKNTHQVEFLAVCKTPAEKGTFSGTPAQRIQVLQKWLQMGGDYVDIDVSQNDPSLITQLPNDKLWLSFHDFTWANPEIIKLRHQAMQAFDPAIYKFAVTPETKTDLEAFVSFTKNFNKPAIFTTMGKLGAEGREQLKPYTWGAFYALSPAHATASGQPSLQDL